MITLELGAAPAKPLSMNEALHWAAKARRTKPWRETAQRLAEASGLALLLSEAPCIVTVVIPVQGAYRRDPHNYMPVVKAVIDGLVAAGVWPDDTPDWVTVAEPVLATDGLARVNLALRDG